MTDNKQTEKQGLLGTFAGVFTPSILTILGIILFLRLGYVVGSSGLMYALLIISIANCISILTSFSLAAIATNLDVKGGGDYYLISRTLGLEFGGALGLVLFLAQSVSIAFYCIGFGEAVSAFFPGSPQHLPQFIAALAVGFLFLLAWIGADLATKFQYVVMAFLALALFSFYLGGFSHWDTQLLVQNWERPQNSPPFWLVFAIFFPAVTGFTQGVSMSGDLKNPGKSLPAGTFWAVGISILVYFTVTVLFAATAPLQQLETDYGAMGDIAFWGFFIDAGVIAATLSSAMASFLGAPRILQSLASDKIFPILNPFAVVSSQNGNPRRGVLLAGCIACATIALGQLDLIARLVSMFFLISYGLLNYATYYEAKSASPSFRPRFRWYHPKISLAGFLACLGVMLAIDLKTGIVAIAILFAIYQYLQRTTRPTRWADSQRSHYLHKVRENLFAAGSDPDHPRDWRPYILAFSDNSERRKRLLEFASWLEGGSGITTVVQFLHGEGPRIRKKRLDTLEHLKKEIQQYRDDVFPLVITGHDPYGSLENLIESYGLGPISVNTILINWINEDRENGHKRLLEYGKYLQIAHRLGCHLVLLCALDKAWDLMIETTSDGEPPCIDVWWQGDTTSRLMLLLAYLVTRGETWRDATIRVMAINYRDQSEQNLADLQEVIEKTRITAVPIIIAGADAKNLVDISVDSALTFMPFGLKNNEPVDIFGASIEQLVQQLGVTILVKAGQDVDLDAAPEDGEAGVLAQALDALEQANTRTTKAQKEAEKAAADAKSKMDEIEISGGIIDSALAEQLKSALQAREIADEAAKKVLREEAKSNDAEKLVESYGHSLKKPDDQ